MAAIYRDMGTVAAERLVSRALGELTLLMSRLATRVGADDLDEAPRQLRRLQSMADQLGLVTLGLVAQDARACLDTADAVAFAAVWSRLVRVAEQSLSVEHGQIDQTVP